GCRRAELTLGSVVISRHRRPLTMRYRVRIVPRAYPALPTHLTYTSLAVTMCMQATTSSLPTRRRRAVAYVYTRERWIVLMAWALLVIRAFAGLTLAAHGAQKLLGWFGGPGYARTEQGFQARGLRPGWLWAALAIVGEVGGGLSLAFGFLTPLGAAGAVGAVVLAISS